MSALSTSITGFIYAFGSPNKSNIFPIWHSSKYWKTVICFVPSDSSFLKLNHISFDMIFVSLHHPNSYSSKYFSYLFHFESRTRRTGINHLGVILPFFILHIIFLFIGPYHIRFLLVIIT